MFVCLSAALPVVMLEMVSGYVEEVFVSVIVLAVLVVPVFCAANVKLVGATVAIGAVPGGGGGDCGVHPDNVAEADVAPSLAVI